MSLNHVLSSEVTGFHIYEEDNRLHKDCSTRICNQHVKHRNNAKIVSLRLRDPKYGSISD